MRDLKWRQNDLAESLIGDIRLGADGVSLRDGGAEFAGGLLRFALSYRWGARDRGWFSVNLSRAESSRLLVFEEAEGTSSMKEAFQGPLDLHLRGNLGAEWRGGGEVVLSRGKVWGVEVTDLRVPVDFSFVPAQGQGELMLRESSAQLGHGRGQLRAAITWDDTMRVEGTMRFFDASLRSLAGVVGDVSTYAQGRVSGRVEFGGSDMRSINDLTAQVQATLTEAQAMQMPILNLLTPYLLPGQGGTTFRNGELRARLTNGVWRIQQLTLESPLVHLILQGTLTVQGRLDLDVVAQTSTLGGLNPVLVRVILTKLPPVGPVPVGLILQATELLSNRVIRVRITGTTKMPRVQVEPLRVLSEEAVRFFLLRTVLPAR